LRSYAQIMKIMRLAGVDTQWSGPNCTGDITYIFPRGEVM
jgi:hypothetical protein